MPKRRINVVKRQSNSNGYDDRCTHNDCHGKRCYHTCRSRGSCNSNNRRPRNACGNSLDDISGKLSRAVDEILVVSNDGFDHV